MTGILRKLALAFRKEDGTASIEFVLSIPVLLMVFMASFESGMFMARHVMLERAVDMTMRDLRLGLLGDVDHDDLRTLMCERAAVLHDCNSLLKIQLTPVSTTTWAMPVDPTTCVDRNEALNPPTEYTPGSGNELVLVRVCVRQDAMFPTTGIGLQLPKDSMGGYALVARSVFVNEPS
jgi:Flp pilus assembly protein TadG